MELTPLTDAVTVFKANAESVHRLATFDQIVLNIALNGMRGTQEFLRNAKIDNPTIPLFKATKQLEQIQEHGSTGLLYQEVYNQCLVLLVSHFESAARDLYRNTIRHAIVGNSPALANIIIKIPLSELSGTDPQERIVDLHLEQAQGLSFQDMQSTVRAFSPFAGEWKRDPHCTNDLIFSQAARHVIIHRGAVVDQKMMDQIADAKPRTLKPELGLKQKLSFEPKEIVAAGNQMTAYLQRLCACVQAASESNNG